MMRKYSKAEIQSLKQDQKEWQNLYEQIIKYLQLSQTTPKNDDDYERFRITNEYIVYNVKKKKCDLCSKADTFKFVRTNVSEDRESLPFWLCDNCYFSDNHSRAKNMKLQNYVPVSSIIKNIKKSIHQLKKGDQVHQNNYQKYEYYQKQFYYIVNQLGKIFQRNISYICRQLREQFQVLKKYTLHPQQTQIFSIFLEQEHAKLDKSYLTQQSFSYSNKKDQSYRQKKKQNEFIKELDILQSVVCLKSEQENKILHHILLDVENVILKESAQLQITFKRMAKQTEHFSLAVISKNWKDSQFEDLNEQQEQKIIQTCKVNYLEEGIINNITNNEINKMSSKLQTIEIHSNKNMEVVAQKIYELEKLEKLRISNNQVGSAFVEDILKYFDQHKNINESTLQHQKKIMYSKLLSQLKQIEFNCKIGYKKDFISSLSQFAKLQNLSLTWNLYDSFQQINESYYYLQDHHSISSLAPSPIELIQLYRSAKMKYLWIGNCDNSIKGSKSKIQMQKYLQIMHFSRKQLEGLMLGQIDGRQRKISPQIIESINLFQSLKVIYFNKINFIQDSFLQMLERHKNIQGLFLNECENLTQNCLAKINQLPSIKKIFISQLRQLDWQQQMPKLQCFLLQRCFCNTLRNVFQQSNLKALSLYECHFLQTQFIHNLLTSQLKNGGFLTSVNLGHSKINNKTLVILGNFTQIRKLNISGTRLDLFSFMTQLKKGGFKNLRKLQKLCMKQMKEITNKIQSKKIYEQQVSEYYNDLFANILAHFPVLTHLNISHNSVINQRSIRFGLRYLAFVTVTQTKFTIQSKHKNRVSDESQFYALKKQDLKVIY